MIKKIKSILKIILLHSSPSLYKYLFYSSLRNLSKKNVKQKKKEPEMLILNQIVPKNKIAFDIGANYGDYIYLFEKLIPRNKIYAFEPIPKLYSRLKKVFPFINIYDFALSNSNEIRKFKIPEVNQRIAYSRGTLKTKLTLKNETDFKLLNVKTTSIDNFVENNKLQQIGFLKIDVEGNEINVIEGALTTIKRDKPFMLIEIEQRYHDSDINIFIQKIKSLGYECYFLNKDLNLIVLSQRAEELQIPGKIYINNFIFIPN